MASGLCPGMKAELSAPQSFPQPLRNAHAGPDPEWWSQNCGPHPPGFCPLKPDKFSADKGVLASLEQKLKEIDEECRVEESRRVDLELNIVEVKDNLKKAEAGPVTLGTTVDTTHLENVSPRVSGTVPLGRLHDLRGRGWGRRVTCPALGSGLALLLPPQPKAATPTPAPDCTPVNSATALKNRPLSVMVTGKGTVLQKAKVSGGHTQPPAGPPWTAEPSLRRGPSSA